MNSTPTPTSSAASETAPSFSLGNILRLIRVKQWVKNGFIFAALVFSQHLFEPEYAVKSAIAFVAFSFAASSVYVLNDLVDAPRDRLHPEKKFRPIASGAVSPPAALALFGLLAALTAVATWMLPAKFGAVIALYLFANALYSWRLKHVVLVDVLMLASFYVMRVVAGGVAIEVPISSWLLLCTFFLSILLGAAKRQAELKSLGGNTTRAVLGDYNPALIDRMLMMSATASVICYALYTTSNRTVEMFRTESLVYTTVFVIYGVFRYLHLLDKENLGENPTQILLTDTGTILNLLCWILTVVAIIYFKVGAP